MPTTLSIDGLQSFLLGLGFKTPIPSYESANVTSRPLDIGRSYLADALLCILDKEDPSTIYKSIRWPNDIGAGDFFVPVPKFIHDGEEDPEDFAMDLMRKVRFLVARFTLCH